MLARLKLSALRNRLDNLLDEAGRRELSLRAGLILLCEAEVAHRDERRMRMGMGIAQPLRPHPRWLRLRRLAIAGPEAEPRPRGLSPGSRAGMRCWCWARPASARRTDRKSVV